MCPSTRRGLAKMLLALALSGSGCASPPSAEVDVSVLNATDRPLVLEVDGRKVAIVEAGRDGHIGAIPEPEGQSIRLTLRTAAGKVLAEVAYPDPQNRHSAGGIDWWACGTVAIWIGARPPGFEPGAPIAEKRCD